MSPRECCRGFLSGRSSEWLPAAATRLLAIFFFVASSVGAQAPSKLELEARIFGADQQQFWGFGHALAIDGDTLLVGADRAAPQGLDEQGAVYVFVRGEDGWAQEAQLVASDASEGDGFGFSVALQGDIAVVGAPFAAPQGLAFEGAVYVFERTGTAWSESAVLLASDGDAQDRFGQHVAFDAPRVVAGAPFEESGLEAEGCETGAAYVFVFDGASWAEEEKLLDPKGECSDLFGWAVDLSGERTLVGAYSAHVGNDPSRGKALVFLRTAGLWEVEDTLLASDGSDPDRFGWSVSLDGDSALIGAQQKIIDGNVRQGAAYVFRREGADWVEEQRLTASDGQEDGYFGESVALRGDRAFVAAESDFPGEPGRGVVYEYGFDGAGWQELQKISAPSPHAFDGFGRPIAMDAERIVISQPAQFFLPPPGGTSWVYRRIEPLFCDGFESGDTSAWSATVP